MKQQHDEVYMVIHHDTDTDTPIYLGARLNDELSASWPDGRLTWDKELEEWTYDYDEEAARLLHKWIEFPYVLKELIATKHPSTYSAATLVDEIIYHLHGLGLNPFPPKE